MVGGRARQGAAAVAGSGQRPGQLRPDSRWQPASCWQGAARRQRRSPSCSRPPPLLPPPLHRKIQRCTLVPATQHPSPSPTTPAAAGSYFTLSLFDKLWHPELSQEEALVMMEKGIEEIKKRLVVAPAHFIIKVIDKEGIKTVKVL
jgi:hypothetical protein